MKLPHWWRIVGGSKLMYLLIHWMGFLNFALHPLSLVTFLFINNIIIFYFAFISNFYSPTFWHRIKESNIGVKPYFSENIFISLAKLQHRFAHKTGWYKTKPCIVTRKKAVPFDVFFFLSLFYVRKYYVWLQGFKPAYCSCKKI